MGWKHFCAILVDLMNENFSAFYEICPSHTLLLWVKSLLELLTYFTKVHTWKDDRIISQFSISMYFEYGTRGNAVQTTLAITLHERKRSPQLEQQ